VNLKLLYSNNLTGSGQWIWGVLADSISVWTMISSSGPNYILRLLNICPMASNICPMASNICPTVMTITIMWLITATILNHTVTPAIMIWSYVITWLFLHTFLGLYDPRPMPWPQYAVLHSCGTLHQTYVSAYMYSPLHRIMFTPLFPCTFSTPIPMPHVSPSLYVNLCMTYTHLSHHTPIGPDTIMNSDPTCLSI